MSRLAGHELAYEGAPFNAKKQRTNWLMQGVRGVGRGLCSCGELSDNLPSGAQRKAWHREHKNTIRGQK